MACQVALVMLFESWSAPVIMAFSRCCCSVFTVIKPEMALITTTMSVGERTSFCASPSGQVNRTLNSIISESPQKFAIPLGKPLPYVAAR